MKGMVLTLSVITAAVSLAAGLGSASAANESGGAAARIGVARSGLGAPRSSSTGGGARSISSRRTREARAPAAGSAPAYWPPLRHHRQAAGGKRERGVSPTAPSRRADGRLQVTYNHHPLYTFVKDTKRGADDRGRSRRVRRRVVRPFSEPEPRSKRATALCGQGLGAGGNGY